MNEEKKLKLITGKRITGKTTELVKQMKKDKKSVLLVWNYETREFFRKKFRIPKGKIDIFSEYRKYDKKRYRIYIDDCTFFIKEIFKQAEIGGLVVLLKEQDRIHIHKKKSFRENGRS